MASSAVLNIRLPQDLKEHGNQVLERNGISVSQIVRDLYKYMEEKQELPQFIKDSNNEDKYEKRRKIINDLRGSIDLPDNIDLDNIHEERIMKKYGERL